MMGNKEKEKNNGYESVVERKAVKDQRMVTAVDNNRK
jgi:hypothetical protein